jgi:hypothetical protein
MHIDVIWPIIILRLKISSQYRRSFVQFAHREAPFVGRQLSLRKGVHVQDSGRSGEISSTARLQVLFERKNAAQPF